MEKKCKNCNKTGLYFERIRNNLEEYELCNQCVSKTNNISKPTVLFKDNRPQFIIDQNKKYE